MARPKAPTVPAHYVNLRQVAEYGGVSRATVRRMIDEGVLPVYRVPNHPRIVRVHRDDLDRLLIEVPATEAPDLLGEEDAQCHQQHGRPSARLARDNPSGPQGHAAPLSRPGGGVDQ